PPHEATESMIRLRALDPQDADALLLGQDDALAREISGGRWDRAALVAFLDRCSRWSSDGPIREYAAVDGMASGGDEHQDGDGVGGGRLLGGGGLNRLAPGVQRGHAAMTYWVLPAHRGKGLGQEIASALVDCARGDQRISQLVLFIAPHNDPSRAVARNIGAAPTGTPERHPADPARVVDRWVLDLR
ncbi:MAG: GNAT family N-acetyltransferase, partial [Brachybacterium tyrofermentans]